MTIAFKTLGGEGQDIVLIHGFGSDRMSWLANSPALLKLGRVHSLDLPGHGDSIRDVGDGRPGTLAARVAEVLEANGISAVHVIGHSLGGGIALLLATRWPRHVASLALIAPLGLGTGVDRAFLDAFPEIASAEEATRLMQTLVVKPQLIGKQVAQRVLDQLSRDGSRQALRTIARHFDDEIAFALPATLPRLAIWGREDRTNPPSPERLAAFGGEHVTIDAAAHLPHIENPRGVNEHLVRFLSRAMEFRWQD